MAPSELLPEYGTKVAIPDALREYRSGLMVPTFQEGRQLLMAVFVAADCTACVRLTDDLLAALEVSETARLAHRILLIPSSAERDREYLRAFPIRYLATADSGAELATAMGVRATPSIVVLDRGGRVLASFSPASTWPVSINDMKAIPLPPNQVQSP